MKAVVWLLRRFGPVVAQCSFSARWQWAGWLAALLSPFLRSRQKIIDRNLALCFPTWSPERRQALAMANRQRLVFGLTELLQAWYAPSRALVNGVHVDGMEHLHAAKAAGQGVMLFTGHFLQTELVARLLREATGVPVGGVVRANNNASLEAELRRVREGIGPIFDKFDTRGLVRHLRDGGWVVYSADQDFNRNHAFVPFFGVPAATLINPPQIAAAGRATTLWFHGLCDATGTYRLTITPMDPNWTASDPVGAAAIYMRELEALVRQAPEQYLWAHRRFKTRPPGQPSLY